jgi:hypothetical protein
VAGAKAVEGAAMGAADEEEANTICCIHNRNLLLNHHTLQSNPSFETRSIHDC